MFHEHGGQFGEVGGAASAGDDLAIGAAEDGMDGVAHFVEDGLHVAEGEEGWFPGVAVVVAGFFEIANQGDGGELVDGICGSVIGDCHTIIDNLHRVKVGVRY